MNLKLTLLLVVCLGVFINKEVNGHGYMIHPPNRASLWRIDWRQPSNYEDNEFFCGGTHVQYVLNGGKCGPCGDNWSDPVPRSNENGGTYGNGLIFVNYTAGEVIPVTSILTANHLGSLHYSLCELTDPSQPETEECFKPLRLADGTASTQLNVRDYQVISLVKLPDDFACDRCVLRWHYRTGNSWGDCPDGSGGVGCGDQEVFRSCADIRILPKDSDVPNPPEVPVVSTEPPPPPSQPPVEPDSSEETDSEEYELVCHYKPKSRKTHVEDVKKILLNP
ncbi:hypothetical protein GWI33_019431 [Rhynchophorus ferrugineus]|uniref:Chitin-binding type-4 domain-containing protein n=1 Tax=Rhynchophorus ferrugineus TaxID=354439 RepID=A0A834HSU2_RHYFE|nr:hypothetical protein GWI33_019431 [Rhynchophorus ferrugineus]